MKFVCRRRFRSLFIFCSAASSNQNEHIYYLANLDNGKVIHLVIRPIDAPHNPMNGKSKKKKKELVYSGEKIKRSKQKIIHIDDPNPGTNIRHSFGGRGGPNGRSRPFPSITSRLPMMEGYAFITLDSNLGDLGGDNQSVCVND
jgi:hypothetical protein